MKRSLIIAAAALVVLAGAAFAQSYSVDYFDGTAEVKTAKGWTQLSLGDSVPANASVRVSQGGSLELSRGKARITIIRDGTYELSTLAQASDKTGASRTSSAISKKLQSLTAEKQPTQTAAGGVRGAQQGGQGNVQWVEESDETRTQVASLFAAKKYLDAVKVLEASLRGQVSAEDAQEYKYLLAAAWYGAGQSAKAYRSLSQVVADPSAQWYAQYVILKAQVYVDATDFTGALNELKPFLSAYPAGEAAQVAYLLTYYCQKGLGDSAAAAAALDAGYKIDPTSETAALIDQQRKGM